MWELVYYVLVSVVVLSKCLQFDVGYLSCLLCGFKVCGLLVSQVYFSDGCQILFKFSFVGKCVFVLLDCGSQVEIEVLLVLLFVL